MVELLIRDLEQFLLKLCRRSIPSSNRRVSRALVSSRLWTAGVSTRRRRPRAIVAIASGGSAAVRRRIIVVVATAVPGRGRGALALPLTIAVVVAVVVVLVTRACRWWRRRAARVAAILQRRARTRPVVRICEIRLPHRASDISQSFISH